MVKAIPDGYTTVTPYLTVRDVAGLLSFLKRALNAKELLRFPGPNNTVMHAEVQIGNSRLMMGEPMDAAAFMPAQLYLYLDDVDGAFAQAVKAGAEPIGEPTDRFYGDRTATVRDAYGNRWTLATHREDVSVEEMQRRMAAQAVN
jgi:PhnB protein